MPQNHEQNSIRLGIELKRALFSLVVAVVFAVMAGHQLSM